MGTVSSTLKLNDHMSPVMRHILQAMNQTLSVMEQLDSSTRKADFSKQFGLARHEIESATRALDDMNKSLQDADNETKQVKDQQKGVSDGFKDWQRSLMAVNAALSLVQQGVQAIKSGARLVDDHFDAFNTKNTAEVQLAVVMANQGAIEDEYSRILQKAPEIQGRTMYGNTAMISGAGELATYLKDTEALNAAMDTLSMYAAGMSAGGVVDESQMLNYATQLGKAFDGQMDGMTKKGFSITDEQKEFLKNASDMERVAMITDMIAESWHGLDEAVAQTPQGVVTQFLNDYSNIKELSGEAMAPAIVQLFQVLRENLPLIQDMMLGIANSAAAGMGFVSDYIIPILIAGFEWLSQNIEMVQMALMILGAIAAAVGLSMAISWLIAHWPLLLIVGAVVMLTQVLQQMGYTADDVMSFIGGLFGGLFVFIYNIVVELYNLFATFAEFFANVFDDPIGSIMRLFAGLADFVLGILQNIASAIDAIFGSNLSTAIGGWRDGLSAAVTAKYGDAKIKIDRMEQISVSDGVKQGIQVAENLANALDNLPDFSNPVEGLFAGAGGGYGGGLGDGGNIGRVGSVGRIEEDVTISEEDIKMLKDIASRDYQLHYTQLTPNLTATFGDIRETADAGAILEFVEDSVAEALQSSLVVKN